MGYSFEKIYNDTGEYPSIRKIAADCGLSPKTVHKHCESLTLDFFKPKYKLATDRVMKKLIKKIETDTLGSDVKIFNQLINDYKEKSEHNVKVSSVSQLFESDEDEGTS